MVSVKEHRDSVTHFVRRADVRVEIDGRPLDLVCAPYVMPTETAGLRLLVDTTSGWGNISKQVQLSLWDATDPIVDTKRFGFPLRNFRLFSQARRRTTSRCISGPATAIRAAPILSRLWLRHGRLEGREEVVSATAGKSSCSGPAAKISARWWSKTTTDSTGNTPT